MVEKFLSTPVLGVHRSRWVCYKETLLILGCGMVSFTSFAGDLPQAADRLIQQMDVDMIAARKRAIAGLETVKTIEGRRGNTAGVNAIQDKIQQLTMENVAAAKASAPATPAPVALAGAGNQAVTPGTPTKVTIQANAKLGVQLGPIRGGQHVTLQYVEGRWAMSGGSQANIDPEKLINPDESNYPGNSLGIFAVENGEAKMLAGVPNGTKHHPFHFHFLKDYSNVILRIQDGDPADNPGAATYEVTLSK